MIGTPQTILVERDGLSGHAENFAPVRFGNPQIAGKIVPAIIAGVEKNRLIAQEAL
uniref:hypothetical protein n=1 Tax=Rhizorhapis sp. SPR117 TaxID=2912611 RepID=UPI0030C89A69